MENPERARQQREQNVELYRQKHLGDHLAKGHEGKYVVIGSSGRPHGVYSSREDAQQAESQLHTDKPLSATTISRIEPA